MRFSTMFHFRLNLLISVLIHLSVCREFAINPDGVDKTNHWFPDERIIGGNKTGTSLRYMVYIEIDAHDPTDPLPEQCGGTLISSQHVLTAAHCLESPKTVKFMLLNAYNTSKQDSQEPRRQRVYSKNFTLHPSYNNPQDANDLAIIKLTKPVKLGNFINKVKLEDKATTHKNYNGSISTSYGWGLISENPDVFPDVLQKVDVEIMEDKICEQVASAIYVYPGNGEICTSGNGNRGTCGGDSGGPLMLNGFQIGVVSRGATNSCIVSSPSIYERVGYYRDWIDELMKY